MTQALSADVLVIGGGSTGVGVAWEATRRGLSVILAERSNLAGGTSGRFHGLLHSGGRYVVSDPRSASECAAENKALRSIAPQAIEDTGGLFVSLEGDDPAYAEGFPLACERAGVEAVAMSPAEARSAEPAVNPGIQAAFWVPDASVDVWRLLGILSAQAAEGGAKILEHHEVVSFEQEGQRVLGARLKDSATGETRWVSAQVVVNATGAWSGRVAAMAGCEVEILASRGVMVAFADRLSHLAINRCIRPSDGDIVVPIRTVSVIGTTDVAVADPDDTTVAPEEVAAMVAAADQLIPGAGSARTLRAWAGVRPLYRPPGGAGSGATRTVSRAHALVDHATQDGVEAFVTITGGKLTTLRLMAEEAVDLVVAKIGLPATPAFVEALEEKPARPAYFRLPDALAHRESVWGGDRDAVVCECEGVLRSDVVALVAAARGRIGIGDLRRSLRVGMGPCQGGFCSYRCAGLIAEAAQAAEAVTEDLVEFWKERFKGTATVSFGAQARQEILDRWLYASPLAPPGEPVALP